MRTKLLAAILAIAAPLVALGQTIPNGGFLYNGQEWTVPQWTAAWESKVDVTNGILNYPLLNSPTFSITGLTQCLHVNPIGVVSGTGIDCVSGGGSGNAVTVNGTAVPASSAVLGSNSSSQLVTPSAPANSVLSNNTGSSAPPAWNQSLAVTSITGGTPGSLSVNVNGYVGGEGLQNICTQSGSPCYGDTMWVNETALTCTGSPATVAGISSNGENLTLSPYVGAQAVVTGCGPAAAQNTAGGITVATQGTGYASSPNPTGTADYIVVAGGTPMAGPSFTGVLSSTGVLTVSGIAGSLVLGSVINGTSVGNGIIIRDFISGTGGNGTYQTTYAGAGVSSEAMTGTNQTVIRVMATQGPLATLSTVTGTGTAGGPYTNVSLTDPSGAGTGAIGTVTMNGGIPSSVTVTTAGTGYITGYNVAFTIPGGSGTAHVATVTGNAIAFAAIVAGGEYATPPTNPVSQSVTSGSGTGAQFTLSYGGLPIYGTIATINSASGFTFAAATSANTITAITGGGKAEQLVAGHADDAAVSATLATLPVGLFFPHTQKAAWVNTPLGYGFNSPITIPNYYRFSVLCQGTRLMPLSPINAQMTTLYESNTTLFYKSLIDNCDMQGMGIANYNYSLGAARFTVQNGSAENALIENIFIGDAAGDNAANIDVNGVRIHNDTNAVPAWPAYNYEISGAADNTYCNLNADSAMWGGMLINGADDQGCGTNSHLFAYAAGPGVDVEATKAGISLIVDNMGPGQAGYWLNGSLTNVHNGSQCSNGNTFFGQYCVYVNNDQRSTIGCLTGANNSAWAGEYANLLFFGFSTTNMTTRALPCAGNGSYDVPIFAQSVTAASATLTNLTVANCTGCSSSAPLLQSGIPFGVPATTVWDTTGDFVIGANPASSATTSFSATSGSVTVTFSAATLSNSASDVGRVITVLDTTYKTCLVTANLTTTTATCTLSATLSGTGPFTNANSWISGSGTAAQATGGGTTFPAALSYQYPSIYLYFSGTTAGPSTQGVYYCVMASLATGTCYGGPNSPTYSTANGTLTGASKPAIPASTSALTTTAGTNAPTVGSAIILPLATLPANTLGLNGCLDYDAGTVSTNSANNKSTQVRLNTFGPSNTMTTQPVDRISVKMCNAGAVNSQVSIILGSGGATSNMQVPATTAGVNRASVSTSSNQTVSFSFNMAAATDSQVLEYYSIKATAN